MTVWVVTTLFPVPSETFVTTEVRVLQRIGAEVSVHALGKMPATSGPEDIEATHANVRAYLRGIAMFFVRPKVSLSLLQLIGRAVLQPKHLLVSIVLIPRVMDLFTRLQKNPPDVIHLYWGHYPSLLGYLTKRFLPQVTLSVSLSAYDLTCGYACTPKVAQQADVVRTWARANIPTIASLGVCRDKIIVCYQGIDLGMLPTDRPSKPGGRILSAGRLIPEKGMLEALEAFSEVRKQVKQASFVVLGDGPQRKVIEHWVTQHKLTDVVFLRGHVPHSQVLEEMAEADVFVLLSRHRAERLPNVVKEAMAMRCVCLTTKTPGIEELIPDSDHGLVISADQAAENIIRLFSDPEKMAEISSRAENFVRSQFSVDTCMAQLMARWRDIKSAESQN